MAAGLVLWVRSVNKTASLGNTCDYARELLTCRRFCIIEKRWRLVADTKIARGWVMPACLLPNVGLNELKLPAVVGSPGTTHFHDRQPCGLERKYTDRVSKEKPVIPFRY